MKIFSVLFLTFSFSSAAVANDFVNGYTRKDGTYVEGYYRSAPDEFRYNNRGSQSNGGSQRDEYSNGGGATNKTNQNYNQYDNDRDGISNGYDRNPDSKKKGW